MWSLMTNDNNDDTLFFIARVLYAYSVWPERSIRNLFYRFITPDLDYIPCGILLLVNTPHTSYKSICVTLCTGIMAEKAAVGVGVCHCSLYFYQSSTSLRLCLPYDMLHSLQYDSIFGRAKAILDNKCKYTFINDCSIHSQFDNGNDWIVSAFIHIVRFHLNFKPYGFNWFCGGIRVWNWD